MSTFAEINDVVAPARFYGDGGTIHDTGALDVEVDKKGNVVAVWFRCQMLPFRQEDVDKHRAKDMRGITGLPKLTGVVVRDQS